MNISVGVANAINNARWEALKGNPEIALFEAEEGEAAKTTRS
jgi:hypothetical protein